MELEKQVCTREQGKKLVELGITAKPHYWWIIGNYKWDLTTIDFTDQKMIEWLQSRFKEKENPGLGNIIAWDIMNNLREKAGLTVEDMRSCFPAYTVAELAEMLPDYYPSWRFPVHTNGPKKWVATVICSPKPPGIDDIHTASEFDRVGDTQAEALATLLIALLETETITIDEVNNRI